MFISMVRYQDTLVSSYTRMSNYSELCCSKRWWKCSGDNWNCRTCKNPVKSLSTYRRSCVTRPTVSKILKSNHSLVTCLSHYKVCWPTDQKLRLTKCCCPTTTQHCSFYCKPVHIRGQKLLLSNTEKSVDIDRLIHKAATVNTDLLVRHDGRQYYCLANTSDVWFGGIVIGCWT